MSTAYVFSLSDNADERNYSYMALMLVKSIKDACSDADVYCGIFTNHPPPDSVIRSLEQSCTIVKDVQLQVSGNDDYFLREYTCWYFSHVLDLTKQYNKVVYTDIDVLHFKPIPDLTSNEIYAEPMPEIVKKEELLYNKETVFFNWLNVLTPTNKAAWEIDFSTRRNDAERAFTENIERLGLMPIKPTFGAIYPVRPLTYDSSCFHYDNFEQRGYFYKLRRHPAWRKYKVYLGMFSERYYENYWERKQLGLEDRVMRIS